MEALYGQRHLKILSGSTALLADVVRWMGAIANSDVTCRRLFLAGDLDRQHGATMFTPEGFQMIPVFESFRAVYSKYRPDLDNAIKEEGWPPPAGSHRSRMLHGESKCRFVFTRFTRTC